MPKRKYARCIHSECGTTGRDCAEVSECAIGSRGCCLLRFRGCCWRSLSLMSSPGAVDAHVTHPSRRLEYIPSKGDRVERRGLGVTLRGTVLYADRVQVLVKWDNGRSSSLRLGVDDIDMIYAEVSCESDADGFRRVVGQLNPPPPRRSEANEVAIRIAL
jgi:hypothetical protein